jgi:hypothetical protein
MGARRYDREQLRAVCDGVRSLPEVASILGWKLRTVKRLVVEDNLPRRKPGSRSPVNGANNPAYAGGRSIDDSGYALSIAPEGHPNARRIGRILEHRLVMERSIGRYLTRHEVVDHIDGLTLHNDPSNLRLFACNGDHLSATLSGPQVMSEAGKMNRRGRLRLEGWTPVDIHRQRKARGDVRLLGILRAALSLGIDSPHLLGTKRWLVKAGIDPHSRPSLEQGLSDVLSRYELDLGRSG